LFRETLAQGQQHGLAPGVLVFAIDTPAAVAEFEARHCYCSGTPQDVSVSMCSTAVILFHRNSFCALIGDVTVRSLFGFGSAG
jgi:hypothetical protein